MTLTKHKVYQVEVTEDDHVQVRCKTLILEDGEIISSSLHRHVVSPGQDYSGEIGKVRRCCQAVHIPTVVDREITRQLYEEAKRLREVVVATHDAAEQARANALQARSDARDAYAAAVLSDVQEDIDAALVLRTAATQAHSDAVAARVLAQTAMDEAHVARLAARDARDSAIVAHDQFIIDED